VSGRAGVRVRVVIITRPARKGNRRPSFQAVREAALFAHPNRAEQALRFDIATLGRAGWKFRRRLRNRLPNRENPTSHPTRSG